MNNNLYWSVYKNLEAEFLNLSNLIHINDEQLEIYSIKISELLIRTVVEVESISKELYFVNGGSKPNDKNLFFDTDCIDLLENKWQLSKKHVLISASNLYLEFEENIILTPLKKANKRGTSSSEWLRAYQAIKHNRAQNLKKGNLKQLIRSLAGLFLLNIYFKDFIYTLEKDGTGTNFDGRLGSEIFSVKIHINKRISIETEYSKNDDFENCVYLLKATDETKLIAQNSIKILNKKISEKVNAKMMTEVQKRISGLQISNQNKIQMEIKNIVDKIKSDFTIEAAEQNSTMLRTAFEGLRYEAILNKCQY
ncbi:MAG TPA: hypothetical protein DER09_11175 [Prolixibacteraceae bacterium]|nr:hypothetical protein [Prolixibacteraceae bacterium]